MENIKEEHSYKVTCQDTVRNVDVYKADKGKNLSGRYPEYIRAIRIREANGCVNELVFPKALDLDRPKRVRTIFSPDQLLELEREFQRSQYLVGKERTELAKRLKLSEIQIKVWFQNRRTKYKRDSIRDAKVRDSKSESLAACNILRFLQQDSNTSPIIPVRRNVYTGYYPSCPGCFTSN